MLCKMLPPARTIMLAFMHTMWFILNKLVFSHCGYVQKCLIDAFKRLMCVFLHLKFPSICLYE